MAGWIAGAIVGGSAIGAGADLLKGGGGGDQADLAKQLAEMNNEAAMERLKLQLGLSGMPYGAQLLSGKDRRELLADFKPGYDKMRGLVDQGGILSADQIREAGAAQVGQNDADLAAATTAMRARLAASGIKSPSLITSSLARMRAGALGADQRVRRGLEMQNAMSLPGLISQGAGMTEQKKGLMAPSWGRFLKRIPEFKSAAGL